MFAVPIEDLPLNKREQAFCKRADLINASQILFARPDDSNITRQLFDSTDIEHIKDVTAKVQAPQPHSVLSALRGAKCDLARYLHQDEISSTRSLASESIASVAEASTSTSNYLNYLNPFVLTSGDEDMDALLGGGWRRGCISEIVGESASGKSQLGMQTAVFTALGLKSTDSPMIDTASPLDASSVEDDLFYVLRGCGVKPRGERGGVAFLVSGGQSIAQMLIRRMVDLSKVLIEERWNLFRHDSNNGIGKEMGKGVFQRGRVANSLEEAQIIAKKTLLENIHIAHPLNYDSLEHAVTYSLPNLYKDLKKNGKAGPSLVIIDDLREILGDDGDISDEKRNQAARHNPMKSSLIDQSRMVATIADRLKRFAMFPTEEKGSGEASAMAILVMNQVVGLFRRNNELVLPDLQVVDVEGGRKFASGPPPLQMAYQQSYYNGSLHNGNLDLINRPDRTPEGFHNSVNIAAMSLPWVNCINVRILLAKTKQCVFVVGGKSSKNDKLLVRKAISLINPFSESNLEMSYLIRRQGLRGLSKCPLYGKRGFVNIESIDEEDQLWSSLDVDLSEEDIDKLLEEEKRSQMQQKRKRDEVS